MDQFNWVSGLDKTGWIATALFVVFFIIATLTVVMMLKLNAENKKIQKKNPRKKSQTAAPKVIKSAPEQTAAKSIESKNDDTNSLEEAEVFLTYGLNKQAADLLEKYLKENPSDKTAREMLKKARSNK